MDLRTVGLGMLFLAVAWHGVSCSAEPPTKKEPAMTNPATDRLELSDAEWQKRLTPEQYRVLRRKGTEPAFCGGDAEIKKNGAGTYVCVGCGAPLFTSRVKFDSGTGWPSFWEPIKGRVASEPDSSYGMTRIEVHCTRCGGHLGHRFDDGPAPTHQRYCINAVALRFVPGDATTAPEPTTATATFAAGCFWGVQSTFDAVKGVVSSRVGYCGGTAANPTYQEVCGDRTGHAEAVEVIYDPAVVSYDRLLELFFANHDPTRVNSQGPDVGTQYRSVIFVHDDAQRQAAEAFKAKLQASGTFKRPIATQIVPATTFWPAEDYHQKYLENRGLSKCHL